MKANYPFLDKSLPLEERITDLLSRLTADEKAHMMSHNHQAVPRLGIRECHIGCEIARGFVSRDDGEYSTVFPQPVGMASMFDPELMENIGRIASDESRYYNKKSGGTRWLYVWGPTVDMERNPLWGRTEEAYGEDPFLAGKMTAAYTKGLAGDDDFYFKTVPTLKHFCANNSEFNRVAGSSNLSPRLMHEYYYRPFEMAVKDGGAASVMTAYNEINGVPADMNPDLKKVLKDEWGVTFIVTDGGDFSHNVNEHHFCKTHGEAIALCVKNGCDTMTDNEDMVYAAAADALKKGHMTEKEMDSALRNVLRARFRTGEFDEGNPYENMNIKLVSDEAKKINRRAADEQICLLKNDGILPLDINEFTNEKKLAVIGPTADKNFRDWYCGISKYSVTVKDGFESLLGNENVICDSCHDIVKIKNPASGKYIAVADDKTAVLSDSGDEFEFRQWGDGYNLFRHIKSGKYLIENNGMFRAESDVPYEWFIKESFVGECDENGYFRFADWNGNDVVIGENGALSSVLHSRPKSCGLFEIEVMSSGISRAEKLAEDCDAVIFCGGNDPMMGARECVDRTHLRLPEHQKKLLEAVRKNPDTVFLLISSYPYSIVEENEKMRAVIYSSHAGDELGNAAAAAVFGITNPAARLPLTWYRSEKELPDIADYDIEKNKCTYLYYDGDPLYPFGYGLSYSKFEYENMNIKTSADNDGFDVSVTVKNASEMDGDEVVQIYFGMKDPSAERPEKKLCGFKRVHIRAGNSGNVTVHVRNSDLGFYDVRTEKMRTESGIYNVYVGASSADIRLSGEVNVVGETIGPRKVSAYTKAKNYDVSSRVSLKFSREKNDWFVRTGDWGGQLIYRCFDGRNGVNEIKFTAAAPIGSAKISVSAITSDGAVNASAVVECSPSDESFGEYSARFDATVTDIFDLVLDISGGCGLYGFEFR